uniref:Uncharacterized protein n=1 Tax=Sphaerodactylus townsendi TaxID=933632 RepID=A0ACB8FY56_9SAUR
MPLIGKCLAVGSLSPSLSIYFKNLKATFRPHYQSSANSPRRPNHSNHKPFCILQSKQQFCHYFLSSSISFLPQTLTHQGGSELPFLYTEMYFSNYFNLDSALQ